MEKCVATNIFTFNPDDNGGESLSLETKFLANGDPGVVLLRQKLTLQSYCNAASFELVGAPMTPDLLRELAIQLEKAQLEAEQKTK